MRKLIVVAVGVLAALAVTAAPVGAAAEPSALCNEIGRASCRERVL